MARPTKTRISLSDLESVEIPQATLPPEDEEVVAPTEDPPDVGELSSLPAGVSPEVARLLGADASAAEPAEAEIEAVAPVAEPPARSRAGLVLAIAVLAFAAAIAGWYGTRPPELDGTLYTATEVEPPDPATRVAEVGFRRIPEPVVAEPAAAPAPTPRRRASGAPARVRGEDLF